MLYDPEAAAFRATETTFWKSAMALLLFVIEGAQSFRHEQPKMHPAIYSGRGNLVSYLELPCAQASRMLPVVN